MDLTFFLVFLHCSVSSLTEVQLLLVKYHACYSGSRLNFALWEVYSTPDVYIGVKALLILPETFEFDRTGGHSR
jgi:hypothetical protein